VFLRRLPNFLTFLRVLASPLLVWLIVQSRFRTALLAALLAGLTDWFDGFAARKLNAGARFGVILDPLADKVLLVTLFIVLGVEGLIPLWLLIIAVCRDLVIVTGSLLLRILRNRRRFVPKMLGKVSTFFQIILVLLVLVQAAFPHQLFLWLQETAVVLTTVFTVLSGLDYVRLGIQMARLPALQTE
jgi:cardiolipin synthase